MLVAEAFLPMRKSVEILGADMKPAVVRSLITESLNCMLLKSDWHLRKEAADTIAALAASSQVLVQSAAIWLMSVLQASVYVCSWACSSCALLMAGVQEDSGCLAAGAV